MLTNFPEILAYGLLSLARRIRKGIWTSGLTRTHPIARSLSVLEASYTLSWRMHAHGTIPMTVIRLLPEVQRLWV